MNAALVALVAWLAANTPFEPAADAPLPSVVLEEPRVIQNMAGVHGVGFLALYEARANRIWMSTEVDLDTVHGRSAIVHELIHWAQVHAPTGKWYECEGVKEFEAYGIQEEYQEAHGMESTIPWMKVFTFYSCPPPFAPGAK